MNITWKRIDNKDAIEGTSRLWTDTLDNGIELIFDGDRRSLSFEELHRTVYQLVIQKHGGYLQKQTEAKLSTLCTKIWLKVAAAANDRQVDTLLTEYNAFGDNLKTLSVVYMYYDKNHAAPNKQLRIAACGKLMFKRNVLDSGGGRLLRSVISSLLSTISSWRCKSRKEFSDVFALTSSTTNNDVELSLESFSGLVGMIRDVGQLEDVCESIYLNEFVRSLLETSREFFVTESMLLLNSSSDSRHLVKYINMRVSIEEKFASLGVDSGTVSSLLRLIDETFVEPLASTIIYETEGGIASLFAQCDISGTEDLIRVSKRSAATLKKLCNAFREHLMRIWSSAVSGCHGDNYHNAAIEVVNIWTRAKDFCQKSSEIQQYLGSTVYSAFEDCCITDKFFNSILAYYMDSFLKEYLNSALDIAIINNSLAPFCMSIFKIIPDKDRFERTYRKLALTRILNECLMCIKDETIVGVSIQAEQFVLSLMRIECGDGFTSKIDNILSDLTTQQTDQFNVSPVIVSTAVWPLPIPTYRSPLPPSLESLSKAYEAHYATSGRCLRWAREWGFAEVYYYGYSTTPLTLFICSTTQLLFLLWFNEKTHFTIKELSDLLEIPPKSLLEIVREIIAYSKGLLVLEDDVKTAGAFENERILSLNWNYKPLQNRIQLWDAALHKPNDSEKVLSRSTESLFDPRHLVDSVLVKIMKANRRFEISSLIAEVNLRLGSKFQVDPEFLWERIDNLCEREYLRIDPEDPRVLIYIL